MGEKLKIHSKTCFLICSIILLILATRFLVLQHNMHLHPDEPFFYQAADSLKSFLAGTTDTYTEEKEYPEGAIVFQLPFHILAAMIRKLFGIEYALRIVGRVAAVFYFCLGVLFCLFTLKRFFSKSKKTSMVYGIIICFSLIHIEQSRYGTGDAISFALISILMFFSAKAITTEKYGNVLFALFISGALCAVKYPLIYFIFIPIAAGWQIHKKNGSNGAIKHFISSIIALTFGFLLCSPKVVNDPLYVLRALEREYYFYVSGGNVAEVGGVWNHLLSVTVYFTLYSGIILAPVVLASGIKEYNKTHRDETAALFGKIIPIGIGVFFIYNLFASTLFMRTYYPFFFICDLYIAYILGEWLEHASFVKCGSLLLLSMLIFRGGYCIYCLAETDADEKFEALINNSIDNQFQETTLLLPGYFLTFDYEPYQVAHYSRLEDSFSNTDEELLLKKGELVITGTEDYSRCNPYFFKINDKNSATRHAAYLIQNWNKFKIVNAKYYLGSAYPEYYYYLFGYWIKGTTGTDYEFPSNRVYYRS